MLSPALNFVNDTTELLVKVTDADHLKTFKAVHACDDTYLIYGSRASVEAFSRSEHCLEFMQCQFPKDPWRREYRYLGDIPTHKDFSFDLRLRNTDNINYSVQDPLPPGCRFENGILCGRAQVATEILDLKVCPEPLHGDGSLLPPPRTFQIRFFSGTNRALSFTSGHYLQYGYGPQLVDYDPRETYFRIFKTTGRPLATPFEEAQVAARKAASEAGQQTIYLFVSGGIDSQSMVQAFVAAQVPFVAVLMEDVNGCNKDDVYYAKKFFSENNIPLQVQKMDYIGFIRSYSYVEMAAKYRFNNPEYGILLHMMDKYPGYPVYAGRPISVSHSRSGEQVIGLAVDETWSRARYLERERKQGCSEFLIHTPELMESFLQLPIAVNFPLLQSWGYKQKLQLLDEAGFDIRWAPPTKLTGFETMEFQMQNTSMGNEIWLHHRAPLKLRYPNGPLRNAIPIERRRIGSQKPVLLKTYEDGFSHRYVSKNDIKDFH